MDNIKNNKTEKEIEKKVSEVVKKDIERLLLNKEGKTPAEGSGDEWRKTLNGKDAASKRRSGRSSLENRMSTVDPKTLERKRKALEKSKKQSLNNNNEAKNRNGRTSLEDRMRTSLENRMSTVDPKTLERKQREKFQKKLSKINRQSIKDVKKNIKERSRKIAARKKMAFKKKLKEKMKKKITMNAKEGKSITMSLLFVIFLFIALLNDSVDIVVGIVSWSVTLTGVGAIVLVVTEVIGNIIDIVTTILLIAFSFYIGGTTKAGAKRTSSRLLLYLGAFAVELIPWVNLFITWFATILYDFYKVRKRATEAERMDEKIKNF